MGLTCSKLASEQADEVSAVPSRSSASIPDPAMHDLMKKSCILAQQCYFREAQVKHDLELQQQQLQQLSTSNPVPLPSLRQSGTNPGARPVLEESVVTGQAHLLYRQQQKQQSQHLNHQYHSAGGRSSSNSAPSGSATAKSSMVRESLPTNKLPSKSGRSNSVSHAVGSKSKPISAARTNASKLAQLYQPGFDESFGSLSSATSNTAGNGFVILNAAQLAPTAPSPLAWLHDGNGTRTHANQTSCPTRLVVRRHPVRATEEGMSGTHIYAVRWPAHRAQIHYHEESMGDEESDYGWIYGPMAAAQEQHPNHRPGSARKAQDVPTSALTYATDATPSMLSSPPKKGSTLGKKPQRGGSSNLAVAAKAAAKNSNNMSTDPTAAYYHASKFVVTNNTATTDEVEFAGNVDHLFKPSNLLVPPQQNIVDWATVSEEHNIYIADVGLTTADCDAIVQVTEQVCRGQYAAYTYAKQTLGCREYPVLAVTVQEAIHTVTHAVVEFSRHKREQQNLSPQRLALDDREPHMVKYDVTKRERQKLDMHTDKSEWTFLIALSNGCGLDFDGGGTYFECLDATLHLQRGHALIFPGRLRHCGQRITSGLRFLLVGFLVDKTATSVGSGSAAVSSSDAKTGVTDIDHDEDFAALHYMSNIP